jgi:molybdopterin converting factor small subunit
VPEEEWDPRLDELAAELRQRVGDEFRQEAEELERLSEQQRLRNRTLSDAAQEVMSRGDRVSITTGKHTFTGRLVSVRGSLLQVETPEAVVDANLEAPVHFTVIERSRAGGSSARGGSGSFKARLSEYEQTGEALEFIISPHGEVLRGRILVVGTDHIVVRDDEEQDCYLPLGTVAAVVQRRLSPR